MKQYNGIGQFTDHIIAETIKSTFSNGYFKNKFINVYIKKTVRYVDGTLHRNFLTIGNIQITQKMRGKGIFKEFLALIEEKAILHFVGINVESILTYEFAKFFRKGEKWTIITYDNRDLPCDAFYLFSQRGVEKNENHNHSKKEQCMQS
jgi:hypothetical protein